MKTIINFEEEKLADEMADFIKTLTPDMQEKLKVIIWWESLKMKGEIA